MINDVHTAKNKLVF